VAKKKSIATLPETLKLELKELESHHKVVAPGALFSKTLSPGSGLQSMIDENVKKMKFSGYSTRTELTHNLKNKNKYKFKGRHTTSSKF
jgi:hypothetical protein